MCIRDRYIYHMWDYQTPLYDIMDGLNLSLIHILMPKRENVRNEILNWFGRYENHLHIIANYTLLSHSLLNQKHYIG